MAKSSGLENGPSTTGEPSGKRRANNDPKITVKTASDSSTKATPKKK